MFDEKIKAKLNGICKAQGRLSAIKYIRTHLATTMSLLEAKRTLDNEIPEEKLDKTFCAGGWSLQIHFLEWAIPVAFTVQRFGFWFQCLCFSLVYSKGV